MVLEPPGLVVVDPRPQNVRCVSEQREVGQLPRRKPRVRLVAHVRPRHAEKVRGALIVEVHFGDAVDAITVGAHRAEDRPLFEMVSRVGLKRLLLAVDGAREHRRNADHGRWKCARVILEEHETGKVAVHQRALACENLGEHVRMKSVEDDVKHVLSFSRPRTLRPKGPRHSARVRESA